MTLTTYRVTSPEGTVTVFDNLADVIFHVGHRRGYNVRAITAPEHPCELHPAFEADYCPACGTSVVIGGTR